MNTYVIRRRSAWANEGELELAAGRSKLVGQDMADRVRWIRTYVVSEGDGRLGSVCIYEGVDEESIREHAKRSRMPADEIATVTEAVIVREDPVTV